MNSWTRLSVIFWVCDYSMQSACAVLYCHLRPLWLYHICPHYFINGTILGKKLLNIKRVLIFSASFNRNISHFKKNSATYHTNVHVKYPLFLQHFVGTWIFSTDFRKKKNLNIKFQKKNPPGGSRTVSCGQTDMQRLQSKKVLYPSKTRRTQSVSLKSINGVSYFDGQVYARTHARTHANCHDKTAYPPL